MAPNQDASPFWQREDRGRVTVVRLLPEWAHGEELANALRTDLFAIIDHEGRDRLVFDLAQVGLMDSLFLTVVFAVCRRLRTTRGRVALVNARAELQEVLQNVPIHRLEGLRWLPDLTSGLAWCAEPDAS